MASLVMGLRGKSMIALLLACLLALLPAVLLGWQLLDGVRSHFGEAYARNFTQLNLQKIVSPVARDLALSTRLAGSELTRQWLLDEADPAHKALFFREAEGYRGDFSSRSFFLTSALSGNYYYNAEGEPPSDAPRYVLDRDAAKDAWFFNIMSSEAAYNINVNPDEALGTTRVWLNVVVTDGERRIGLAGTGLDLGEFIRAFLAVDQPGVTPIILDDAGAIQAHPDPSLIAYGSAAGLTDETSGLDRLFARQDDRAAMRAAMTRAAAEPDSVQVLHAEVAGRDQLLAVAYAPQLGWHIVTAVDLNVAEVLEGGWVQTVLAGIAVVVLLLLGLSAWAVDRMVLEPLRGLRRSATEIARGRYDVSLPAASSDEIGDLSRAFGSMADQVRSHTEQLESQVRDRTAQLERSNREMEAAHRQIRASIDYASVIQRATLPDRQLSRELGDGHFILWRPRDVVGGDFYVFRSEAERCLIGVVDCAGHGVPGALMTMLARTALDLAIEQEGLTSPAAILRHTDEAMRALLADFDLPKGIATNMDVGIVCVDRAARSMRFAGAKISLYWSDGEESGEVRGHRRAIGDRKRGEYEDTELALAPNTTCYLATDGFLDQAGGERGFGFGNTRFAQLLRSVAALPMAEQAAALDRALESYRGEFAQRDDITILSFRLD
ncbi:MAG: biofilm regulation protein phosphatase SiaA [Pseudazoarcus pumilus]|nr:biofilm regulation protein phosphatase SiaA [Pseudazoarcus pumilus]